MSEDRTAARRPTTAKTPIAWHPLFPAIVAVWFGALFGLGALAVRVSLLERLAVASGIDLIIPAAAPPLGLTARIVIGLGLATVGGIVGALVGHLMARSKPAAVARRAEAAAAKAAPINPVEAAPARSTPPSGSLSFIDISELDFDADAPSEFTPTVAMGVSEATLDSMTTAEPELSPQPDRTLARPYFPLPADFPVPGGAAAQRLVSADLDSLSHLELIERLALSLQKQRERRAQDCEGEPETALEHAVSLPPRLEVPSYYPPAPDQISRHLLTSKAATSTEASRTTPERDLGPMLGVRRLADAEPVALFPEPFPAPGRKVPKSDQTERALRDALTALQRMSGAA